MEFHERPELLVEQMKAGVGITEEIIYFLVIAKKR